MSSALTCRSDDELLATWTQLEERRRRLVVEEHALIAEIDQRGLAQARGMRSTAVLANRLLRISPGEARARVQAAEDCGPRRGLTGEALPPIYPLVAAAQSEGAISEAHAKVIVTTIEKLPDAVRAEVEARVESDLVGQARQFDPRTLALLARRMTALLDPDGLLDDLERRHRTRGFRFHRRTDGSAFGTFELDPECAEHTAVTFAALAAPKPAADGTRDARSTAQRWHDALLELCRLAMRAEVLPSSAGVTTTVIIHGTREAFETGDGFVATGTGAVVPAREAKRWAAADSRFMTALFDKVGRLVSYNSCTRLFTEGQRLALMARDQGCSFPGCTAPPWLCQSHHIRDWAKGGTTSVSNGTLLCGYHHREFAALGWSCVVLDGVVHWLAPAWLDHDRVPQRNRAHVPIAVT